MTIRWQLSVGALMLLATLSPWSAVAQGDGPRTHSKGMLTNTNVLSLTFMHASGNTNPLDPAHGIVPGADFEADLLLAGYSRSFSLFGGTAVGSILLPVGGLDGNRHGQGVDRPSDSQSQQTKGQGPGHGELRRAAVRADRE